MIPIEDWSPPATTHVGASVVLTDAMTGATGTYVIGQIDRSFNSSGRENWRVYYGATAPSAAAEIMRRIGQPRG